MTNGIRDLQRRYRRIAPFYDLLDLAFEYGRYRRIRPLLFRGLAGRILDAGAGTGRNMPFYPPDAEVVAADLSAAMLQRAQRRHGLSRAPVGLVMADLTRLAFPDGVFEAAVASFVFCTLPDALQVSALRELARVVKPGGVIRLLGYRQSDSRLRRGVARLWAPWVRWAYGASFDRHTEQYLPAAGLSLVAARCVVDDLVWLIEVRPGG